MSDSQANALTIALGVVGTGIALAALYFQMKQGKSNLPGGNRAGVRSRRVVQRGRDRYLGHPGSERKYFGYSGPSSAAGAGFAAGPTPSIGLAGSPKTIKPTIPQTISIGYRPRPGYSATQNGKRDIAAVGAATPPYITNDYMLGE